MQSLILKRAPSIVGKLTSLKIVIDGNICVWLKYSEEKSIDLSFGGHEIIANMSWTRSLPFSLTLDENQQKRIVIETLPLIEATAKSFIPPFIIFTIKESL